MTLTIESTRFGEVEVADEATLEFPSGLIGIPGTRYALLAREDDATFLWLHSLDDAGFAVPVVNPWKFFGSFELVISDDDAERIGLTDPSAAEVYVTVRAADTIEDFCANLRAPILVADGKGYQVINEAEHAPLRAPLLGEIAAEAA